jgi:hypothetical protein
MLNAVLLSQSTVSSFPLRAGTAQPYASARRTDRRSLFKLYTRALVLAAGSFLLVVSLVDPPKEFLQAAAESVLMESSAGDAQQGSLQ